eukprot:1155245-Pelagomonas_calceolata.AAC.3
MATEERIVRGLTDAVGCGVREVTWAVRAREAAVSSGAVTLGAASNRRSRASAAGTAVSGRSGRVARIVMNAFRGGGVPWLVAARACLQRTSTAPGHQGPRQ